ncbi:MAG: dockerin type I domain-containing protein [Candidatus Roizmanbacteria bacterium]
MKSTLISLISVIFMFYALCFVTPDVSAQASTTYLVKTPFASAKEFSTIFDNSQSVHYTYDAQDQADKPSFILSVITSEQKSVLEKQNLRPEVITTNPDMSTFVLAYHPFATDTTPLKAFGFVTTLKPHYTLVQLTKNADIEDQSSIIVFEAPLTNTIVKPKYDTIRVDASQISATSQTESSIFDPNKDGLINGLDYAVCIRQYFLKGDNLSCDVIKDKRVDSLDLSAVIKRLGKKAGN